MSGRVPRRVTVEYDERVCIQCGCTDMHACDGGCYWLAVDTGKARGVCSQCDGALKRFKAGNHKLSRRAASEVRMRREVGL